MCAWQAAALLKVKTIEQSLVEWPPRRGPEVQVPVHFLFVRLGLRLRPAARHGFQTRRMGMESLEFAELAPPRQIHGENEIRQAAPLRAGLEHAPGSPEGLGQRQALRDV